MAQAAIDYSTFGGNTAVVTSARGWDEIYSRGEDSNNEPWSNVVSFVHRFVRPRERAASMLELGCGSGPNLRFAARLGMTCSGIDASQVALDQCRERLSRDRLDADLRLCPFGALPFEDNSFDCVVDRASLMFADTEMLALTVAEVRRVLKPGGVFFHNTIADDIASGDEGFGGTSGTDVYGKYPDFRLTSRAELDARFAGGWEYVELRKIDRTIFIPEPSSTAEWEAVVRKTEV